MFFGRRQKRGGAPPHIQGGGFDDGSSASEFYRIELDMMLKGAIIKRRSGPVRQFAVTVNGSTRLVTSGDTVDRNTYDALLAASAITPPPGWTPKGGRVPDAERVVGGDDLEALIEE